MWALLACSLALTTGVGGQGRIGVFNTEQISFIIVVRLVAITLTCFPAVSVPVTTGTSLVPPLVPLYPSLIGWKCFGLWQGVSGTQPTPPLIPDDANERFDWLNATTGRERYREVPRSLPSLPHFDPVLLRQWVSRMAHAAGRELRGRYPTFLRSEYNMEEVVVFTDGDGESNRAARLALGGLYDKPSEFWDANIIRWEEARLTFLLRLIVSVFIFTSLADPRVDGRGAGGEPGGVPGAEPAGEQRDHGSQGRPHERSPQGTQGQPMLGSRARQRGAGCRTGP